MGIEYTFPYNPSASYKVYRALVTQSGTAAPVATVLEDSLGISQSDWSRVTVGVYIITKPLGFFPPTKTIVRMLPKQYYPASFSGDEFVYATGAQPNGSNDLIHLETMTGGSFSDGLLEGSVTVDSTSPAFIEIIVYP